MKRTLVTIILTVAVIALTLTFAPPARGQTEVTDGILAASPASAAQGETITVTFTLDTARTPPLPPSAILPGSATLGTMSGAPVTRPGTDTVTAQFVIGAAEPIGFKDAAVTFSTPSGTLVYSKSAAFEVTDATDSTDDDDEITVEGTYPVVDTAQIACYDNSAEIAPPSPGEAFYGQDAQHAGHQPSYTVSADGLTVQDNVTGLVWTKKADWNDDGTIDIDDKVTYHTAQTLVDTLNAQAYGGHTDWRVPTIKELYSLMDFRGTDPIINMPGDPTPFIDTDFFDFAFGDEAAGERNIDSQWVTTTLYVSTVMGGQQAMFGLNLADGRIKGYPTAKDFYARFCRGNPDYGINNFQDNTDGTVTDKATWLMWSQDDSCAAMDWAAALDWVEQKNAQSYLGHSDWRLPNAKELQSLVDYTRSPDTTASAAIDPVFNCTQITNLAGQADYPWYWTGTTHARFDGSGSQAVYICFGRGMGSMDGATAIDVHGAGCQRSDPKTGSAANYPAIGFGPQGDVQRVFNYVRLVRDATPTADEGTATASAIPDQLPSDGRFSGVLEIVLTDADGAPITGQATLLLVTQSGDGVLQVGPMSETADGLYEATLTGIANGRVTLTVAYGGATLDDTPVVDVYTAGQDGYPVANAGPDQQLTDADASGDEPVTLDGSASAATGGIASYAWFEGETLIATGASPQVVLAVGTHTLLLVVDTDAGLTDMDDVQIELLPPQLEVTAAVAADQQWCYQNTPIATSAADPAGNHTSAVVITLASEANPGDAYTVSLDDGDGDALQEQFRLGTVTRNADSLTVALHGGWADASTPGGPHTVTLTVTDEHGRQASASIVLTLRQLGDIDGDDSVGGSDKLALNNRLNGVEHVGVSHRACDLSGDGSIGGADLQIMNNALNGAPVE